MYSYANLQSQCLPQSCAKTSNTKFLQPNVVPSYFAFQSEKVQVHPASCNKNVPRSTKPPNTPTCKGNGGKYSKDPTVWGKHLWYYLHTSAANYPQHPSKQQKDGMKNWLCSLKWTMPCENCSMHFGKYIEKHRSSLDDICSSRDKLFTFLVDVHNQVNKRTGKPQMGIDEAVKLYQK